MTGNEIRLGPDDLVGREFAIGLRGYDRDEVDAFLGQAADAWRTAMAAAPPVNGLSASAMSALADSQPEEDGSSEAPTGHTWSTDPFAAPAPPPVADEASESTTDTDAPLVDVGAPEPDAAHEAEVAPVAAPVVEGTRAEAERDRTTAYAERKAAELDRAQARTELAQSQEEALHVIDQAQRRAEAVLTGARGRAEAEAEAVLEDARSRLTPLLEQERTVRARLERLRTELETLTTGVGSTPEPSLPEAADLVTAIEDDPDTPATSFPVGYGSVPVSS